MDESSRLEGVAGRLGSHPHRRKFPQFVVDEREKLRGSLSVAAVGRFQETGYVSHAPILSARGAEQQRA